MHLTPGVVHNFPKAVGVKDFCPLCTKKFLHSFSKRRGKPPGILVSHPRALVSTIDGSPLPQDCVEEQLC